MIGRRRAGDVPSAAEAALLAVPGVAGVWTFATRPSLTSRAGRQARAGSPCAGSTMIRSHVAERLAPRSRAGPQVTFAGPFETITPWEWDWFDPTYRQRVDPVGTHHRSCSARAQRADTQGVERTNHVGPSRWPHTIAIAVLSMLFLLGGNLLTTVELPSCCSRRCASSTSSAASRVDPEAQRRSHARSRRCSRSPSSFRRGSRAICRRARIGVAWCASTTPAPTCTRRWRFRTTRS